MGIGVRYVYLFLISDLINVSYFNNVNVNSYPVFELTPVQIVCKICSDVLRCSLECKRIKKT